MQSDRIKYHATRIVDYAIRAVFARIAAALLIGTSVASAADEPPQISLNIPQAFKISVSSRQFHKGQVIDPVQPEWARLTALASFMEYAGHFGDPDAGQVHHRDWRIAVYNGLSKKTLAAYANAKDGYEADLNECPEFLGCGSKSYLFARFERKHFRWGDGVSFFSQSTQDTGLYVPHNGHLQYEIWGVTSDHKFTVVASVMVTHSKLANWGPTVRDAPSIETLKRDRDYRRVERCSPKEFEPSLTAFDQMLDSLIIR